MKQRTSWDDYAQTLDVRNDLTKRLGEESVAPGAILRFFVDTSRLPVFSSSELNSRLQLDENGRHTAKEVEEVRESGRKYFGHVDVPR